MRKKQYSFAHRGSSRESRQRNESTTATLSRREQMRLKKAYAAIRSYFCHQSMAVFKSAQEIIAQLKHVKQVTAWKVLRWLCSRQYLEREPRGGGQIFYRRVAPRLPDSVIDILAPGLAFA